MKHKKRIFAKRGCCRKENLQQPRLSYSLNTMVVTDIGVSTKPVLATRSVV